MVHRPKPNLPIPRRMVLTDFSLFSLVDELTIDFPDGVLCLAGANGLGKSTFIAILNYAITGLVPEPQRRFESVDEYYHDNMAFARSYFAGRVSEKHRATATVTAAMTVADSRYRITRGFFEREQLRDLAIQRAGENQTDFAKASPEERHQAYMLHITRDAGLASFQQLVFLQHFVLTFDERRYLLLWQQRAIEQALYLAFGLDYENARRAETYRREAEKADSLARNYNWRATQERRKIDALRDAVTVEHDEETTIVERHKTLYALAEKTQEAADTAGDELNDALLSLADASSREAAQRRTYEDAFAQHINVSWAAGRHPVVVETSETGRCAVCGAVGSTVVEAVRSKLESNTCPLCDGSLARDGHEAEAAEELRAIDKLLAAAMDERKDAGARVERLRVELQDVERAAQMAQLELSQFEKTHNLSRGQVVARDDPQSLRVAIEKHEEARREWLDRKSRKYSERNEKRRQWQLLNREIERQYTAAEGDFVPLFKDLARRFLGLELDIRMELNEASGIQLLIDVESHTRRHAHQLSESQRAFLDIALRMALAQFMAPAGSRTCLCIDTPEGALDIAYEARAGDMFAQFVANGHNLIVTANINTSQLLQNLASRCGHSLMTLRRMTNWTELSEVQQAEERRFEEAIDMIERAFDVGSTT